eukprot:CAMPEP_0202865524 /NCGR_PEP_ID=MMETSP1391-20130828/6212_1 /ASSEMBLY_ACC=CAM_ASM_000867 /TAXON_ID=1034604 /ORGANISM="Chlamydomonas leiostraca, Strain SAG 11-49" /LENGTH=261 /DNA_ID=CAMNT_0049545383 /DNA_START=117 /DNA_END=902 /DNA_ORIENTATION=+
MQTNPLLAKPTLGKVKPLTFANPAPDHVFGYEAPKDSEGARELTMVWKEHNPSPTRGSRPDGSPMPDFTQMNKLAAKSGLTTAKQLPEFRATHMVAVKTFDHTKKSPSPLPSNRNAKHTYGMPSGYRTAEVVRTCGPQEPQMKHLVQGAYQDEWVRTNIVKEGRTAGANQYIPPVPTRATIGHAIGAQRYMQPHHGGEEWKMTKFRNVSSKVPQWMGGRTMHAPYGMQDVQPASELVSPTGASALDGGAGLEPVAVDAYTA